MLPGTCLVPWVLAPTRGKSPAAAPLAPARPGRLAVAIYIHAGGACIPKTGDTIAISVFAPRFHHYRLIFNPRDAEKRKKKKKKKMANSGCTDSVIRWFVFLCPGLGIWIGTDGEVRERSLIGLSDDLHARMLVCRPIKNHL